MNSGDFKVKLNYQNPQPPESISITMSLDVAKQLKNYLTTTPGDSVGVGNALYYAIRNTLIDHGCA